MGAVAIHAPSKRYEGSSDLAVKGISLTVADGDPASP
jgi:hypothetical protein